MWTIIGWLGAIALVAFIVWMALDNSTSAPDIEGD